MNKNKEITKNKQTKYNNKTLAIEQKIQLSNLKKSYKMIMLKKVFQGLQNIIHWNGTLWKCRLWKGYTVFMGYEDKANYKIMKLRKF